MEILILTMRLALVGLCAFATALVTVATVGTVHHIITLALFGKWAKAPSWFPPALFSGAFGIGLVVWGFHIFIAK